MHEIASQNCIHSERETRKEVTFPLHPYSAEDEQYRRITANYNTLYRIAYQYTRCHAETEDIVQEVFLKMLETKQQFESDEHCKAWLIRVTINRCKNWLFSVRRFQHVSLEDAEAANLAAPNLSQETELVFTALAQLKPNYRNVLYLYYYEGYSIPEIAKLLRRSQNTISSWLTRGRAKLKEVLHDDESLPQCNGCCDTLKGGN